MDLKEHSIYSKIENKRVPKIGLTYIAENASRNPNLTQTLPAQERMRKNNVVIVMTSWKGRHRLWSTGNDDVTLAGGDRVWDMDRYGSDVIIIISVQFSDVRNV